MVRVGKVLSIKAENISSSNQLHMQIDRKKTEYGLVRQIAYFIDHDGNIVGNRIVLQYFIDKKICGNVEEISNVKAPSWGEKPLMAMPKISQAFIHLKKHNKETITAQYIWRKNTSLLYDNLQKTPNADYGDLQRSKTQVADHSWLNKRPTNENEVEVLLAYNEELEDRYIIHHGDLPSYHWVLATQPMINNLKNLGKNLKPMSIDPVN